MDESIVAVNPQMAAGYFASLQNSLSELLNHSVMRFGIVIDSCCTAQESAVIHAIGSPISNCCVTSLVIIGDEATTDRDARAWLEHCRVTMTPDKVQIMYGPSGYQAVLDHPTLVDAIFVMTPASTQHMHIMQALRAEKHVLFYDRISQPFDEFNEQLQLATKVGRFLQSSTMFIHHHRVQVFLGCVLYEKFGNIELINAKLILNYKDATRWLGVDFPLQKGDGCVRRLGRFCVLITVMLLSRAGSRPVSAQVTNLECDGDDPLNAHVAHGTVRFTDNRVLTFHVAYAHIPTRQVLEVHADHRYATMTDFVIEHRDGLATYRVYDKDVEPVSGKSEVVKAESLDVMSGPPQDVMMWRDFSSLCGVVQKEGYTSPSAARARELANIAIYTKRVLLALEESIVQKREVPVTIVQDFVV